MLHSKLARAFSLVELLVTILILSFVVSLASSTFVQISNYSRTANSVSSVTDKSRTAFDLITRELALAGRGWKDMSQLEVKFDNGFGISEMLSVEELSVSANGFSDITLNYFLYDPTDDGNQTFITAFAGDAPFAGDVAFFSDNANGEFDSLQEGDIFLIYQYASLANPNLFNGSATEAFWNIPNINNSGVIVQLSPNGAPAATAVSSDNDLAFRQNMTYSNDGFLPSGGGDWKPITDLTDATESELHRFVSTKYDQGAEDNLSLDASEAAKLVFARKIGGSNSYRSVRYFVNDDNQLIRSTNGNDQVVIDNVTQFQIRLGLDTNIEVASTVQAVDLDGSVSMGTSTDISARWINTIGNAEDVSLTSRHAVAAFVTLEVESTQVDRTLIGATDRPDAVKRATFSTQIRLGNNLPKGVLSVSP